MHAFLAPFLLIAHLFHPAPHADVSKSIEALRTKSGRIYCSTFNIRKNYWLTARHCVLDENGKPYPGNINGEDFAIYKTFDDMDTAIVYTERQAGTPLKLSLTQPEIGDKIYVMGHGLGWEGNTLFKGIMIRVSQPLEDGEFYGIFDMRVFPGHSGSPVLNEHNEVISVLQCTFENGVSCGATWEDLDRETRAYWSK